MVSLQTKHFISSLFKTDKGRPIYFNEYGIPFYGTKKGDYSSAIQCGFPVYCEIEILDPDPVDSVIPNKENKINQTKVKVIDNDELYNGISVRKKDLCKIRKKDKRRLSEKRKSRKKKVSKEFFWEKHNECFNYETLIEDEPEEDPPEEPYEDSFEENSTEESSDYDSFDETDYFDRWDHKYYFSC